MRAIFAERQDNALTLRRGFSLAPDDRVVVIEDVVTTGGSTRETMAVATAAGATVVGAGAIIDRSGGSPELGVPFRALVTLDAADLPAGACPLCAAGQPVIKPGSQEVTGLVVVPRFRSSRFRQFGLHRTSELARTSDL